MDEEMVFGFLEGTLYGFMLATILVVASICFS